MEIALNWDVVLIAAGILLFAYNFLLGQDSTLKLILSIYIATLTADGVARLLQEYIFEKSPAMTAWIGDSMDETFLFVRLGLFLLAIVIFVVKGGFHIGLDKHDHWAARMGIHAVFSFLSAALFLATVLIFFSGNSFVDGLQSVHEFSIYKQSVVARILLGHYQVWFSLPAIGFLVSSFFFERKN
ncbi:hypothetical protein HN954_03010 [bacterium]|jgi:hypothetical protein|nr:hypothetical protein [bacterium]MBT6831897.1 hypothetical protein [bacterium]MBT6996374.1 hypothetical protein [bacterium]MBT7772076.1 hypothetical protein [bacterium]